MSPGDRVSEGVSQGNWVPRRTEVEEAGDRVAAMGIHYVGKGTVLGDNAQGERDGVAWMVHR